MAGVVTRAMQRDALRALGVETDGTVASVTITPSTVVVVHVREPGAGDPGPMSWTETIMITPAGDVDG